VNSFLGRLARGEKGGKVDDDVGDQEPSGIRTWNLIRVAV